MATILGDISFDAALGGYGDTSLTIDEEIRRDLLRSLITSLGSQPFGRSVGMGLDLLENETAGAIQSVIYVLMVASAVARYNDGVATDRKVVTSQDWITVEDGDEPGQMFINILYVPLKDLSNLSSGGQSVQQLSFPTG